MHDLMVACQEIAAEDVRQFRTRHAELEASGASSDALAAHPTHATAVAVDPTALSRWHLQNRPVACPSRAPRSHCRMRYSLNWKACELRRHGQQKCMARFPQCVDRKYKAPKKSMAERLQIGWTNVARVRAACLAIHGYDPELENLDQSPFHNNDTGSQNVCTLAVAGSIVPLIEGHADTRERWTANFTTFSNKERLRAEGPPYMEFVFKTSGERLEMRLRE